MYWKLSKSFHCARQGAINITDFLQEVLSKSTLCWSYLITYFFSKSRNNKNNNFSLDFKQKPTKIYRWQQFFSLKVMCAKILNRNAGTIFIIQLCIDSFPLC